MPIYTDQMGREIELPDQPKRIISLVPSQTELLYELGLENEVVGITKFCVHPESWFRNKPRIGGTKNYNLDLIRELQPDLIIGNKEENEMQGIRDLEREFPVWMSDIKNLEDAFQMIRGIGSICQRETRSRELVQQIQTRFNTLNKGKSRRVLYLIWYKPWMAAGTDTFINEMLCRAGWENVLSAGTRYPQLQHDEIVATGAELILLSSEPFPFKEQHRDELQQLLPKAEIRLVDGELFSWYGSRLLQTPDYLQQLIKSLD